MQRYHEQDVGKSKIHIQPMIKSPNSYVQFQIYFQGYLHEIQSLMCNEVCQESKNILNIVQSAFCAHILEQFSEILEAQSVITSKKFDITYGLEKYLFLIGVTFPNNQIMIKKAITQFQKIYYSTNNTSIINNILQITNDYNKDQLNESLNFLRQIPFHIVVVSKITDSQQDSLIKKITEKQLKFEKNQTIIQTNPIEIKMLYAVKYVIDKKDRITPEYENYFVFCRLYYTNILGYLVTLSLLNAFNIEYGVAGYEGLTIYIYVKTTDFPKEIISEIKKVKNKFDNLDEKFSKYLPEFTYTLEEYKKKILEKRQDDSKLISKYEHQMKIHSQDFYDHYDKEAPNSYILNRFKKEQDEFKQKIIEIKTQLKGQSLYKIDDDEVKKEYELEKKTKNQKIINQYAKYQLLIQNFLEQAVIGAYLIKDLFDPEKYKDRFLKTAVQFGKNKFDEPTLKLKEIKTFEKEYQKDLKEQNKYEQREKLKQEKQDKREQEKLLTKQIKLQLKEQAKNKQQSNKQTKTKKKKEQETETNEEETKLQESV